MNNNNYKGVSDFIFVNDEIRGADVIIIPGSSRSELVERAYELLDKGMAKHIIVSGSKNKKLKNKTEAEFLKELLIEKGIESDRIVLECNATNTYENALFSLWKCEKNGIRANKIIIVCKNYHSRRVKLTFESVFKDSDIMISSICDSTEIRYNNWYYDEYKKEIVFGEVKKIGEYILKNEHNSFIKSFIRKVRYEGINFSGRKRE